MKFFGSKARRNAGMPTLARPFAWVGELVGPMAPYPAAARYEDRVRAGYVDNAVAQRAARLVCEAVAAAPLLIDDAATRALISQRSGGQVLLETVALHLLLHGNAYVQVIPAGDGASAAELYALRPDRISIETDRAGWPLAYAYRAGGEARRIPAEDGAGRALIIHIRSMHPLDDHYGLGALSAASRAIALHNAAADWNRALLANAARPSGALVYDPGEAGAALSPAQFERLQAEMDRQFQGAANTGRPLLLDGGLKWQAMSMSPADMDFIALRDGAAREIAMAFGVPPMLLGLPGDATYANYREASKALWRQTVLPLATTMLDAIRQGLATWGMAGRLTIDLDRVPALSEDRERLWERVSAADFLASDEKRAMLGIVPASSDGARP